MLYGDSNCGKSFFALDLAYHVAAGHCWFGNRVKAGDALYVAAEGGRGFSKRIAAIRARKVGLDAAGRQNLSLLPLQIDLHGAADSSAILVTVRSPASRTPSPKMVVNVEAAIDQLLSTEDSLIVSAPVLVVV